MAFAVRNLSVLAYAQGFTLWHYRTMGDPIEVAVEPDYFEPAGDLVAGGDMLLVSAANGGRVLFADPSWGRLRTAAMT